MARETIHRGFAARRLPVLFVAIVMLSASAHCARDAAQMPSIRKLVLLEMARILKPCVQPTTTSRVFTRCFDTHSSIHAHWAAYRMARNGVGLDLAISSWVALQPTKLQYETRFMRYPYAAAWFLRLAIEYEKWATDVGAPDARRLRSVGDTVAAWLKNYYDTRTVNPYLVEYNNPAWALYHLHSYYEFTSQRKLADHVNAKIRKAFLVIIKNLNFGSDLNSRGFFSVYGNWLYVIARTQPRRDFATFLSANNPILDKHLQVNNVSSAHSYGLIWSRMWALRAIAQNTPELAAKRRYERAADAHLYIGLQRHLRYRGNFGAYDHWVPQFAIYAITEDTAND